MDNPSNSYHPEDYWSKVAERIEARGDGNVMAGDDSPYYRYKRRRFLEMLNSIDVEGRSVLEIGHGPGGNLIEILKRNPKSLTGVDISENMISLAKSNLEGANIKFIKTDGKTIELDNQNQDVVFSATVLQHNSDEEMMKAMLSEMFRVSSDKVVLFERIEKKLKGDELCVGRPVSYYTHIAEENNFKLAEEEYINIQVSYIVCGGIRKIFSFGRKEGEPLHKIAIAFQSIVLPVTKLLDKIFTLRRDLGKLAFERKE